MWARAIRATNRSGVGNLLRAVRRRVVVRPSPHAVRLARGGKGGGGGGGGGGGEGGSERAVLIGLLSTNVAVYLAVDWNSEFAQKHLVLSQDAIRHGRYHTMLTSAFAHGSVPHIAMNMLTLYFFGPPAIGLLGAAGFLRMYLSAAVASSALSLAYLRWLPSLPIPAKYRMSPETGVVGASGAVNATLAITAIAYPTSLIYIYMVIPVPAALAAAALLAYDLRGAYYGADNVAHAGHVGGMLFGALWYALEASRV